MISFQPRFHATARRRLPILVFPIATLHMAEHDPGMIMHLVRGPST